MKVAYYSDLHLEMQSWTPPKTDADVIALVGDIHIGDKGIDWALRHFPDKPVLYIPGNHEYYCGINMQLLNESLASKAKGTNVHVLIDDAVIINGVNFIGTTLWTDFNLNGDIKLSMAMALGMIRDYRLITLRDPSMVNKRFTPSDAALLHANAVQFIESQLRSHSNNVLLSHFGIHPTCSEPQYQNDTLQPAFVSDISGLLARYRESLKAVIYGHTHYNLDFLIGSMPAYTNQRGYAPFDLVPGFLPNKTLEIEDEL
tara:strand:- start:22347 stop:23120 length:774 start_codon:yes stop_codon:yes gene_type:complete